MRTDVQPFHPSDPWDNPVRPVNTSMRTDEIADLDRRATQCNTTRAGIARALIRYGLEHYHDFARELEQTNNQ